MSRIACLDESVSSIEKIVAGIYSFKSGKEIIEAKYRAELREIERVIAAIDSQEHRTKVSKEKTMHGKILYKPSSLNAAFRKEFDAYGLVKTQNPLRVSNAVLHT